MVDVKTTLSGFLLIFLLAGCSVSTNPALIRDVTHFQEAVQGLIAVVETHFDDTEKANKGAVLNNINLQFDLGGAPDIVLPPIFTSEERSARKTVVDALQLYSINLKGALGGGAQTKYETGAEIITIDGLRDLSTDSFDLSHSMDRFQTRDLVSSLSNFSHFLLAPKRDRELGQITQEAHPYIQKLALLLYFDIGASGDQDHECRFSIPTEINFEYLAQFNLCKGGLRGLMATAIAADTVTWQQHLKLSKNRKPKAENRSTIINHILDLQKTGELQEDAMGQSQRALLAMVRAHRELADRFSGKKPSPTPDDLIILQPGRQPIGFFFDTVKSLTKLTKEAGTFLLQSSKERRT